MLPLTVIVIVSLRATPGFEATEKVTLTDPLFMPEVADEKVTTELSLGVTLHEHRALRENVRITFEAPDAGTE